MPTKQDDDFDTDNDDDSSNDKKKFSIGISTVVAAILFLIITEAFFYLLSTKTSAPFGLGEMLFALALAIVITLFLLWMKFIMRSNRYLGAIVGVVAIGGMIYALNKQYSGPYTTTFASIAAVVALAYIIIHFWKSK